MKAQLFSGTALAAALLAAAPGIADAQTAGQPPGPTRAETPGRPAIPASDVDYTKSMERLFQAAQRLRESVQSMAQQPAGERRNQAMAQAREALLHTQQAMVSLPADLRTNQNYRDAEQRVGEAERALQGNQPDAPRAQGAVDALLIVVPKLQADARTALAAAGGAAGDAATVVVREGSPSIQVNQAQPTVTVRQPEPVINVLVPQPEIIVRQPPPQVTVQMPEPQVTVQQERPDVRVVEARPQVQVAPAQPEVQVQRAPPRVNVQQAEGQPQVRYEQQGQPAAAMQQQAAVSGAGAAPAQAGGGAQPAAASPAAAGVPLQRAQSLVGTNVVGANGKDAGEVENLLIDRSGQVRAAVVEWGGFLGIGESRAAVPIDRIQFGAAGNERARLTMTREELERLPKYDRNNLAEYGTRYGWGEGLRLFR